ncbi:MAG: DUF736 family protein [Chloroflexi bacterium]|nr:DUF736 family protein [Chloroflexota bacterium]
MIIGHFAENPASGLLLGHIRTLFFKSDKVVFEPIPEPVANGPSHRIYTGDEVELGAAWRGASKADGTVYYDITLDDPTFAAPIRARLAPARKKGAGLILVWERRASRRGGEHTPA